MSPVRRTSRWSCAVLALALAAVAAPPPRSGPVPQSRKHKLTRAKRRPVRLHHKDEPPPGWKGAADVGFSLSTGDTQSSSLSADLRAVRGARNGRGPRSPWKTIVNATALFSHSTNSAGAEIQSDTVSGGVREDRKLKGRNFLFALAQLDYIQPEGIRLRQTYGAGLGRDLWRRRGLTWSGLAGMTYAQTRFAPAVLAPLGLTQHSAEFLLGEELTMRLGHALKLNHDFDLYPDLSQTGQYRFDSATALEAPLSRRLELTIRYAEFFLNHPLAGNHQNNSTLTAGLGIKF